MVRSSVLTAFVVLALAPSAQAGTVSVADGRVRFEAAPGEQNVVGLARVEGGLEISDSGADLLAGEGCTQERPRRAVCAGEGLIALCGDGYDRVDDPDASTFVDAGCEALRFGNGLTVRSHPVKVTAH